MMWHFSGESIISCLLVGNLHIASLFLSSTFLCAFTATNQKDTKPNHTAPPKKTAEKQEPKRPPTQPAIAPSQIMLPLNISANTVNAAPQNLTTLTPQPVIVNNQVLLHILTIDWCS